MTTVLSGCLVRLAKLGDVPGSSGDFAVGLALHISSVSLFLY